MGLAVSVPAGMVVRKHGPQWIGILKCGGWSSEEARAMADAFLARRGIAAEWAKTEERHRPKVGLMGYRRFDVVYRLEGKP